MKKAILFVLFAIVAASTTTVFADVKIKIRQTMSGQKMENTTYIKGKRQRAEIMNGQTITITQCDLRRDVQINPLLKTYYSSPFDINSAGVSDSSNAATGSAKVEKGGIMYITTTSKDTGERKQMFGYTARHIIRIVEMESTPDSCNPVKSKMEFDEWVIDETFGFVCDRNQDNRFVDPRQYSGGCRDKIVPKTIGTAKPGYPLYQKMTMFDDTGNETYSTTQEVVELSKTTLDNALFDVPSDHREVKDASEMYAAAASPSFGVSSPSTMSSGSTSNQSSVVLPKTTKAAPDEVGAKRPGVVRIGMVGPKVTAAGEGMNANDLSDAVRLTLKDLLKGTQIEIIQLEAKLSSAITDEAKSKECDLVLYANVAHKTGGGGFGGFGKVLGSVVSQTGIGHTGSVAGNLAGQMATQAIASTLSQNVKAKDEISLDIRMQNGDSVIFTKQYKAKAKSNGEDIVSPMLEQVAQAILGAAKK